MRDYRKKLHQFDPEFGKENQDFGAWVYQRGLIGMLAGNGCSLHFVGGSGDSSLHDAITAEKATINRVLMMHLYHL